MADNEVSDGEAERPLNPIACGHCRQRKRKCDRQLPHCLQCSHDPSNCLYPEQNKRGIPIGFITRLEARLAETEEALFRVIDSTRDDASDTRVAFKPASQRKADRIKEWDTFPLRSMDEIKLWFQNKSGADDSDAGPSRIDQLELNRDNLPTQRTVPAMEFSVPIVDLRSGERATPPLLEANGDSLLEDSWEATAESGRSKAKDLEQKHPNMYF